MCRSHPIVINRPPVTDPKHANTLSFILDGANDAMVTDPIPPKTDLLSPESLAESMGIFLGRETFPQVPQDSSLD